MMITKDIRHIVYVFIAMRCQKIKRKTAPFVTLDPFFPSGYRHTHEIQRENSAALLR